jgi:hypothetical protein
VAAGFLLVAINLYLRFAALGAVDVLRKRIRKWKAR